ncbi:HEXXH motif domain-containing protein [Catellatospora sichuanensis]|uniref:HEXXH motif domain-containing protein n=1 Tax=Catellatospora sichuanensis TaxID=1969805 RepID=UPI001182B390|nr:HEXXH motif domain-containing protein [Catellatospora sichuanensis]
MTTFHEFDPDQFAGLARGDGGPPAVAALRAAQLSRHLLLVGHLLRHWPGGPAERDAVADTLDRVRRAAPDRYADVLGAPLVGSWTGIVVRAVERGVAAASDFGQLCGIAAVAAAAAGEPADLAVPVRDGVVSVPGLGALVVGDAASARLIADGGRLTVVAGGRSVPLSRDPGEATVPGWLPVHRLRAPGGPGVALDDVDPYRHGHHAPPANRLDDTEVAHWQAVFAQAWGMLERRMPGRAGELATGLQTLVPLAQTDPHSARSATIKYAFGAFGLTRPGSAADLVVTMVHEFQHSKLSGMLDLAPMSDPADTRRFFAPWRTDPRPLAGLLQGVYAFVGVADAWRALRDEDGLEALASDRFAQARLQVERGLGAVEASGALTGAGERLVAGLRARTDELLAEPLDPQVVQAAEQALSASHRQWIDRNKTLVAG